MLHSDIQISIIQKSPLFDAAWYCAQHPDVAISGLDPAEHYLKIGSRLGRDPGPQFSTKDYLDTYGDVACEGVNPLFHFESNGRIEGRSPTPDRTAATTAGIHRKPVDVVIPVYNALEDVKACLRSIVRCETDCAVRALVINDGSDSETTTWLREACKTLGTDMVNFQLLEHDANKGYTVAINTGLRASSAPYVVTLNSDTIVTPFWLDGLIHCMHSAPGIGITGPLSNAASWQNVPELRDDSGGFAINALPEGMIPERMADIVRQASRRDYPRTTFVNGFCFMIRREVIDAIGYMDEKAFPTGYGEENDFCIRAQDAGFALAYADDTYVFHAKSKSFGTERRIALSKAGGEAVRDKHGAAKFAALVDKVKQTRQMDVVRARVQDVLAQLARPVSVDAIEWVSKQKVLFLLPVRGGGGGAHSVIQEATAMRRMGVEANIAVHDGDYHNFIHLYGDIPDVAEIIVGFREETVVATAQSHDVVVATIFSSVQLLERIIQVCPWILPVYYAQDYEPLFFEENTPSWDEACKSYTRLPGALLVAKTHWICKEITMRHHVPTHKIEPSIDHTLYYPNCPGDREHAGRIRVIAMIRPMTPRRGAGRTMELLARLKEACGGKIEIRIFGCHDDDPDFLVLGRDFDFENHGVLTRPKVAELLQQADVFIDLSEYQAFGRTSLEAMACGVLAVVPQAGGGNEYAVDDVNALVVDTFDVDLCFGQLTELLDNPDKMTRMRLAALHTATRYSAHRAAVSELTTFAPALAARRQAFAKPIRPKVVLVPALTGGQNVSITGSGYVRLLCSYRQDALARDWDTRVCVGDTLPEPGSADTVVLQRDLKPSTRGQFKAWQHAWQECGGVLIYEIDDDLTDVEALRARGYTEGPEALRDRVRMYAEAADAITVSTQHLATVFPEYTSKIQLIPNYIDNNLWKLAPQGIDQLPPRGRRTLKLGYVGTPTHTEDLMSIQGVIKELEANYDIEVEVIGAFQRIQPLFGKRIGLPHNSVYPIFVNWLQKVASWDITIIPLVDTSFNRAKSNLKFVECAALNTAIVCSDNPEYRQIARNGENCLLTKNTPASWKTTLVRLIEDAPLRHRLAQAAYRDVCDKWTVQKNAGLYDSFLRKALYRD